MPFEPVNIVEGLPSPNINTPTYQPEYVVNVSGSGSSVSSSYAATASYVAPITIILDSTSDIITFNEPSAELLIVENKNTGGIFEIYTGSYSTDGGMIFTDGGGNKWKRKNNNNYINIAWYGATPVNNQSNDIYNYFTASYSASISTEFLQSPKIYIPGCPTGYWYYCTNKLVFDNKIEIFGNGAESHIRFFQNSGGLVFNYITTRNSYLHDFKITQYGSVNTTTIGSNYGIEGHDILLMNNVTISQFGDGIILWNASDVDPSSSFYGNTNNCRINNCDFSSNWRYGSLISGSDSNNSIFRDCNWVGNGGVGHYDKSFLGNSVEYPHFASNSSPELSYQKVLVTYSGSTYVSIVDGNINNVPTSSTHWYSLGTQWLTGYPYVTPWSSSVTYYMGGSIVCDGANQYGTILQLYHEADQPPPYAGPGTKVLGKNVTFRNESSVAALNAANGSLYSKSPIWLGDPGGSSTIRGYLSTSSIGIQYDSNNASLLCFDSSSHKGYISTNNAYTAGGVGFTTIETSTTNLGRTTGGGGNANLMLIQDAFISLESSRTTFKKFNLASRINPTTTNMEYGDLWLMTTTGYLGPKPEAVVAKYLEPTIGGSKQAYIIKGFQEIPLSNVSGTVSLGIDYNIATNRGIMYYVQFVGSTTSDDCILNREILIVNRSGTVSVVRNTPITADYIPGGFATSSFNITNVGAGSGLDDIKVEITNLPAETYGKVHIKRIDY